MNSQAYVRMYVRCARFSHVSMPFDTRQRHFSLPGRSRAFSWICVKEQSIKMGYVGIWKWSPLSLHLRPGSVFSFFSFPFIPSWMCGEKEAVNVGVSRWRQCARRSWCIKSKVAIYARHLMTKDFRVSGEAWKLYRNFLSVTKHAPKQLYDDIV